MIMNIQISFYFVNIKVHNCVANLRKKTIYNTNVDLVNDDEHTKFGLILSICCQEKTSSIKGRNSVANS